MAKKSKFDEWEVLPPAAFEKQGAKLDKLLKKSLHEAVDEMFPQSWFPLCQITNQTFLKWMKSLTDDADITIQDWGGEYKIYISFVPDDYDYDFEITITLDELIDKTIEYFNDGDEDKERLSLMAKKLRELADKLES